MAFKIVESGAVELAQRKRSVTDSPKPDVAAIGG
jgi:hypothetical protein